MVPFTTRELAILIEKLLKGFIQCLYYMFILDSLIVKKKKQICKNV